MTAANFPQPIAQISPAELASKIADIPTGDLQLVDVREPQEVEIASIPQFDNFPLSEFQRWSQEIDSKLNREVETFVLCHHGIRSATVCQWLQSQGFTKVKNVAGGIDAYSALVDPAIPRY